MRLRVPQVAVHLPRWWGVALVCAIAVAVVGATLSDRLQVASYRRSLAHAVSPRLSGEVVRVSWSFPFQATRVMVNLEIDTAELAAAERVDTDPIFGTRGELREQYIRSVVAMQAGSAVIDQLAAEFGRIRHQRGLDADEYLELMVAGIQSIPYGDTEIDTLLAPEVLARGSGICTDKSLLLASLLLHEGYDTVVWVFSTQRHVAVGVASDAAEFRDSGYAFIETTASRYIGQASQEYLAKGPVARPPAQIHVGGQRRYHAGRQVEYILAELRRLRHTAAEHRGYFSFARVAARHRERFAERAMESWVADAGARFIFTNAHDRVGVYSMLAGPGSASARQLPVW